MQRAWDTDHELIGKSIAEVAEQCRRSLQKCVNVPVLMELEWAENRLAEFKLWAGGVGAFAGDRASLDARLAVEWETKSLMTNILILLRACIERCWTTGMFRVLHRNQTLNGIEAIEDLNNGRVSPIEHESRPSSDSSHTSNELVCDSEPVPRAFSPWLDSPTTDSESHEDSDRETPELGNLDAAKVEVEQIIDHLTRLGIAIRKSGTTSRSQKADRLFKLSDHQDFLRYLTVIVLGRGTEEGREHFEIDPKSLSPVQERLVMANLRRRNRFLCTQRHAKKLEYHTPDTKKNQFDLPVYDIPVLIEETTSVQQPLAVPEEQPLPETSLPLSIPAVMTATSASTIGATIVEVPRHVPVPSQIAKTDITTIAAKVVYPRPPRSQPGLRFFRCPCCCQTLPPLFRESSHWKKHLMEDLALYTCVIEDCPKPDALYISRTEWLQHIEDDHPRCWECFPCRTPGLVPLLFPSVEQFLSHTQQVHSSTITEDQYASLVTAAARPAPAGISQCPLCDETGTADCEPLLDHIAEHVHSFSMCLLPWPGDEDDKSRNMGDDYFKTNLYFEEGSDDGSNQYNIFSESDKDSQGLASLPSNNSMSRRSIDDTDGGVNLKESTLPNQDVTTDPMVSLSPSTLPEAISGPTMCPEGVMILDSDFLWPPVLDPPDGWKLREFVFHEPVLNISEKDITTLPTSLSEARIQGQDNETEGAIYPWTALPKLPWEKETTLRSAFTLPEVISGPIMCPEGVILGSQFLWPPVLDPPDGWELREFMFRELVLNTSERDVATLAISLPEARIQGQDNETEGVIYPWTVLPKLPREMETPKKIGEAIPPKYWTTVNRYVEPADWTPVERTEVRPTDTKPSRIRKIYQRLVGP